jgi:polyphosphate kinase 2 (PPK2 family)
MDLNVEQYRVRPDMRVSLEQFDPAAAKRYSRAEREEIAQARRANLDGLRGLHERLFAERKQALLIILMAIDTGGKDSTIDRIFSGLNPQGTQVRSFNVPTPEELEHDFLWRIHYRVPSKGRIGIFNRSHYEDVTVVRVHELIDEPTWTRRYDHIREFESLLVESNTAVLKFHLRISREEQAERLRERIDRPSTGSSTQRICANASTGTHTSRRSRTRSTLPRPTPLRGTSSRPTASGTVTPSSRR